MTGLFDSVSSHLASAPLWLQSPVVIIIALIPCMLLASLFLRLIDVLGTWILRTFGSTPDRPGLEYSYDLRRRLKASSGTRIVEQGSPVGREEE